MRAKIIRLSSDEDGVRGVLTLNNDPVCLTLERPSLHNQPNVSCIPPDIYLCKRVESPRHGETFQLLNVPGRTNILFHKGNTKDDSLGCVLLGSEFGKLKGQSAILESSKAFHNFMASLEGVDSFPIQIIKI